MKTEPRLPRVTPKQATAPAPVSRGRLEDVLDRLALTGYRVDREKWKRFEKARLVAVPFPTERGEREAIRRLRRILDVERRLAPTGNVDALCFHLAAAGIEGVPPAAVTRHIIASVSELFVIGDRLRTQLHLQDAVAGPDGELALARAMADCAIKPYRAHDKDEKVLHTSLLAGAFIAFVRSTWSNPRPPLLLHQSSRLVSLDELDVMATRRRRPEMLPPLMDHARIIGWLSELGAENKSAVLRATQSIAAFIRLHVHHYPELQVPWRDLAAEGGPAASTALHALSLVPPVLTAAYLQAGRAPAAPTLDRMLEQLMHFWGTASFESVRFVLSNGAFPWVKRG